MSNREWLLHIFGLIGWLGMILQTSWANDLPWYYTLGMAFLFGCMWILLFKGKDKDMHKENGEVVKWIKRVGRKK